MAAMQLDAPRVDETARLALRAVERDERPVRLGGPFVLAFEAALTRPMASLRLGQIVWECLRGVEG